MQRAVADVYFAADKYEGGDRTGGIAQNFGNHRADGRPAALGVAGTSGRIVLLRGVLPPCEYLMDVVVVKRADERTDYDHLVHDRRQPWK